MSDWTTAEPPSRDLQAILDQIDAEERARRWAAFEACDDCTCARHAYCPGGIIR